MSTSPLPTSMADGDSLRNDHAVKRVFDLIASLCGIIVLLPLLVLVAISILIFDGRPVWFRQVRIGRNGRPFTLLKFRSMTNRQEQSSAEITVAGDARITPIGKILRSTKMDELPQLFNVLLGHMSLVGPRPEVETYTRLYDDYQRQVLQLSPGVTDPASLKYFNESERLAKSDDPHQLYIGQIMPDKIEVNLQYASRANVLTDVAVILKTIGRIFSRGERS